MAMMRVNNSERNNLTTGTLLLIRLWLTLFVIVQTVSARSTLPGKPEVVIQCEDVENVNAIFKSATDCVEFIETQHLVELVRKAMIELSIRSDATNIHCSGEVVSSPYVPGPVFSTAAPDKTLTTMTTPLQTRTTGIPTVANITERMEVGLPLTTASPTAALTLESTHETYAENTTIKPAKTVVPTKPNKIEHHTSSHSSEENIDYPISPPVHELKDNTTNSTFEDDLVTFKQELHSCLNKTSLFSKGVFDKYTLDRILNKVVEIVSEEFYDSSIQTRVDITTSVFDSSVNTLSSTQGFQSSDDGEEIDYDSVIESTILEEIEIINPESMIRHRQAMKTVSTDEMYPYQRDFLITLTLMSDPRGDTQTIGLFKMLIFLDMHVAVKQGNICLYSMDSGSFLIYCNKSPTKEQTIQWIKNCPKLFALLRIDEKLKKSYNDFVTFVLLKELSLHY